VKISSRGANSSTGRAGPAGRQVDVQVQIPHAGQNIIEIEAAPLEGELRPSTIGPCVD